MCSFFVFLLGLQRNFSFIQFPNSFILKTNVFQWIYLKYTEEIYFNNIRKLKNIHRVTKTNGRVKSYKQKCDSKWNFHIGIKTIVHSETVAIVLLLVEIQNEKLVFLDDPRTLKSECYNQKYYQNCFSQCSDRIMTLLKFSKNISNAIDETDDN